MRRLNLGAAGSILLLCLVVLGACFPEAPETTDLPPVPTRETTQATATVAIPLGAEEELCQDSVSGASMSYAEAIAVAQASGCTSEGQITEDRDCNSFTGTWWLGLDIIQPGCTPACVVNVSNKTAEINYRCTGALPPDEPVEAGASAPTPTVGFIPGPIEEVSFQGISFAYDSNLAKVVTPRMVGVQDFLILAGAIIPAHEEFSFEQYILTEVFQQPLLAVYPVIEFASGNELAPPIFDRQQQLLAQKPAIPDGPIPFIPLVNAGPLVQTQIQYLEFNGGEGVRYLTQFGQAYLPIVNRTLFYTFQGITSDRAYYVSLVFPVNHPALPANEDEFPGWQEESFAANYDQYANEIAQQLDAEDGSTFFPDLTTLDNVVRSLTIDKEPPGALARAAYDYNSWQTYTNSSVGYTFFYPPDTVLREIDGNTGPEVYTVGSNNESLPILSVKHYDSDFFKPPAGTDVGQWVLDHGIPHDVFEDNVRVGGLLAAHLITQPSPASYGFDEYYVISDEQLFQIMIWPTEGTRDEEMYAQFLAGFTFSPVQPTGE